jgi:AcrR family transcriptional regulator
MASSLRSPSRDRTRERILDGAVRAVALHGLAKLAMGDVSASAGVARGTLYRYFPTREVLLDALARREAERFLGRVLDALRAAPPGEARLRVVFEHATRHMREHPALQRLLASEPAFVLTSIRTRLPEIRAALAGPLAPLLADTALVRSGAVGAEQLVDWMTRFLISMYLFEDPEPAETLRALVATHRLLAAGPSGR